MSFELSFQMSLDVSLRRSFEASDVTSGALSFETSDARSEVASIEMGDGKSDEVSFRMSILWCFPASSETSFLASFRAGVRRTSAFGRGRPDCRTFAAADAVKRFWTSVSDRLESLP
jgi:hypothetical protein